MPRTVYQCRICGGCYRRLELAAECEDYVLPPPKFKAGDRVDCNGTIVIVSMDPTPRRVFYRSLLDELGETEEDVRQAERVKRAFPDAHFWSYKLSEFVLAGDDYIDEVGEDRLLSRETKENKS